jgi:hypothetical protein
MTRLVPSLVLALSTPFVAAQQTWHISASQLPATIAAAAPGDILLVSGEALLFSGVTIQKPLSIHGVAGAKVLAPEVLIADIARGEAVVFQGFELNGGLRVQRCAGSVLLGSLSTTTGVRMSIEDSIDVAVESCRLAPASPFGGSWILVSNSSVTLAQSEARAYSTGRGSVSAATPALTAVGSHVRVAQTQLSGGSSDVSPVVLPQPAVLLSASTLRLSGAASVARAGGDPIGTAVSAIDGTGTLVLDPAVTLVPSGTAAAVGSGIGVTSRAHPTTSVRPSPIGGTATVTLRGRPGDACWLLWGLPALPETFTGVLGELRIGAFLAVAAAGQLDGQGEFRLDFPVPTIPALRGIVFRWQGLTHGPAAAFLAEPGTECHR